MFAGISSQDIPALESLRSFNFHLPVIVVARSENRDAPITGVIMKHVLDGGGNLRLVGDVPRIVQFNDDCHNISILAIGDHSQGRRLARHSV